MNVPPSALLSLMVFVSSGGKGEVKLFVGCSSSGLSFLSTSCVSSLGPYRDTSASVCSNSTMSSSSITDKS